MARKRLSNLERAQNFLAKKGTRTHKEIVKHLLAAKGIRYTATTRKYYDKLFYGTNAPLRNLCSAPGLGEYTLNNSALLIRWS